jgi:hypothetical protein
MSGWNELVSKPRVTPREALETHLIKEGEKALEKVKEAKKQEEKK